MTFMNLKTSRNLMEFRIRLITPYITSNLKYVYTAHIEQNDVLLSERKKYYYLNQTKSHIRSRLKESSVQPSTRQ